MSFKLKQVLVLLFYIADAILAFKCPAQIRTTIPNQRPLADPHEPRFSTMADVHSTLTKCSNITTLDLRVTLIGCTNFPDRWNLPFDQSGHDKYPSQLKSLSLENRGSC